MKEEAPRQRPPISAKGGVPVKKMAPLIIFIALLLCVELAGSTAEVPPFLLWEIPFEIDIEECIDLFYDKKGIVLEQDGNSLDHYTHYVLSKDQKVSFLGRPTDSIRVVFKDDCLYSIAFEVFVEYSTDKGLLFDEHMSMLSSYVALFNEQYGAASDSYFYLNTTRPCYGFPDNQFNEGIVCDVFYTYPDVKGFNVVIIWNNIKMYYDFYLTGDSNGSAPNYRTELRISYSNETISPEKYEVYASPTPTPSPRPYNDVDTGF